jgi:allantoinase
VLLNSDVIMTIEKVTGQHSRGWLGPAALTETFNTPALLAELGLSYVLAWTNDDQPYPLTVPGMVSVPYSVELTDIPFADSADGGRVMALALHPFVIGQAFRTTHPGVWLTTSCDIAAFATH